MAGELNRDWTNFDLFNAVKKICEEKGLSLYTQHRMVAQEILYELGEISIDSTQSVFGIFIKPVCYILGELFTLCYFFTYICMYMLF